MQVHSNLTAAVSSTPLLDAEHRVQSVFSAVLAAAGREGYASAQPIAAETPWGDQVQSAWNDWFDAERHGRFASEQPADQQRLRQEYGHLLVRVQDENALATPKQFLSDLSASDLQIVQAVHRLAAPIQADELNDEGALNLLLPPAAQVDLNRDGITQSGAAMSLRFPDSNTPTAAARAWEEATAGLPLKERMMHEFRMVTPILLANIHVDESGAFVRRVEPGDPDFVNPMADPEYSYVAAAQDHLDGLDFSLSKGWISQADYDRQQEFWQSFQQSLQRRGAR